MNRDRALERLQGNEPWDVAVVGGGATGLGCAVDAAARGHRTLLLEQHDFAKGTSSRSTKLVHGGVRYLKQGNLSLVMEALRERGLLCRNAPHRVHPLTFVVPVYRWWEKPFYGIGLALYDRLAGRLGLGVSERLSRAATLQCIPTLEAAGLKGGIRYHDAQFDDAGLAIDLVRTVFDLGGCALNYVKLVGLIKQHGRIRGVIARDEESGNTHEVRARVVINATGVFVDAVRKMDSANADAVLTVSQGAHLVVSREFIPGNSALMVPRTPDGRVLFAVPWLDRVLIGTTDIPVEAPTLEPKPLAEEIEFLLAHIARYLNRAPQRTDVLSVYAGLRPLVLSARAKSTAALSREHRVLTAESGLVTVAGGKWTTYRNMAQDAVDRAEEVGGLDRRPCATKELGIRDRIPKRARECGTRIHPRLPYTEADVVRAVREEMARTVEDVLSRRTRALLLDARASLEAAPRVASRMAAELGRDDAWAQESVADYVKVARGYVPE